MQPSTAIPAVAIRDVTLNYFTPERETLALSNVSLDVAKGEFVAIVGSSGCGKSTLLTMVSGLLMPSRGSIEVDGIAVTAPSPRVGYMFQKDTLLDWRTILDNVLIGAELLGLDMARARKRAEALLARYGLGEFMHSLPNQLSGGMRQRAALARTLCCEPDLLLLDEPFSALDYQTRLALSDEIAAILSAESKTVVLVTHDIGEAISMADRVIVMSRRPGRIKSEHKISFPSFGDKRPTPFEARKCSEFSVYFQTIWDELDLHEVH
ncbi:MAG: ATP-binding cassette domain-containing protein [Rhodopseudomonas sp.]|nr:ATP-binding cassette domain-containing protein [Rhodopseudomonas sp.]